MRQNQQSYSNIPYDPRSLNSQVQNYQIQGGIQAGGNQSIVAPYGHPATTVDNSYWIFSDDNIDSMNSKY